MNYINLEDSYASLRIQPQLIELSKNKWVEITKLLTIVKKTDMMIPTT